MGAGVKRGLFSPHPPVTSRGCRDVPEPTRPSLEPRPRPALVPPACAVPMATSLGLRVRGLQGEQPAAVDDRTNRSAEDSGPRNVPTGLGVCVCVVLCCGQKSHHIKPVKPTILTVFNCAVQHSK